MRTYEEVKLGVLKNHFKWFEGTFNLNFVWERTSFEATNKFTDKLHICYLDKSKYPKILTLPATTKPGLKGSLLEPITVGGIRGTAVIESPQQVINGWEFRDTSKEFSKYPYFRQVGTLNYWRDGNKDLIIDKVNRQIAKIFGTHWHIMSNIGTYGSGQVNNWSLGCMGCPEPEFRKILPLIREYVKTYGNKVTGTILETTNF